MLETMLGDLYGEPIKSELGFRRVYKKLDRYLNSSAAIPAIERLDEKIIPGKTIWICWLQGMENAPVLIKKCYMSIKKFKPKGLDVKVISLDNIQNYVRIPQYIWDKVHAGIITYTHLSDLVRAELLAAYGGVWADATVFCSGEIPSYYWSGQMFLFKDSVIKKSVFNISSWWIYAQENNPIIQDTRNLLWRYWKVERKLEDYFLFHIAFMKAVNSNSFNERIFHNMPYVNNGNPHILNGKLSQVFDQEEWDIIRQNAVVHKLSYKTRHVMGDCVSFYEKLLKGELC